MPPKGYNTKFKMNAVDLGKKIVAEAKKQMREQELSKKKVAENQIK